MRKIDIHAHTTKRIIAEKEGSAFLDNLTQEMLKHDVIHTVLLATYFPHRGSGITNFRLYDWIKDRADLSMFGSLDTEHYFYQGISELEELAERHRLKGIKLYTGYQTISKDKAADVAKLAQQYHLPIMLHAGETHSIKTQDFKASDALALFNRDIYGDVDLIISHLANPHTDDLIDAVHADQRLYTDMSGLFLSRTERHELPGAIDRTKAFVDACGPEKLLFGTDYPLQSHEDSTTIVESAMREYSEKDKHTVYYDNARTLLWRIT